MNAQRFTDVAEIVADVGRAQVYEHGWQSWSPAGLYPAVGTSPRPRRPEWQISGYRPEHPAPAEGFQGEGLLAVVPGDGPVRLWSAPEPTGAVPSIRARTVGDRIVVSADGPVEEHFHDGGLSDALNAWADRLVASEGLPEPRTLGPAWCSWYAYWGEVTEDDVVENLGAIERLGLDVETVQLDDGYAAGLGDWLEPRAGFGSTAALAARIRNTGRRAGIWVAPFLAGSGSRLAREHPDWLLRGARAAPGWGQEVHVLDVTSIAVAEHLTAMFRTFAEQGYTYFKLDFLYAGALPGNRHEDAEPLAAYRRGLELIRDAVGPEAILLGCGAPLLPTLGLVDAMRISPDVDPAWEPADGDLSQPGMRSALAAGRARAWQHGRFWVNDPDCLLARPDVEQRETWAEHVEAHGGLTASSDPLLALDERGLELTRRVLRPSRPPLTP